MPRFRGKPQKHQKFRRLHIYGIGSLNTRQTIVSTRGSVLRLQIDRTLELLSGGTGWSFSSRNEEAWVGGGWGAPTKYTGSPSIRVKTLL